MIPKWIRKLILNSFNRIAMLREENFKLSGDNPFHGGLNYVAM